MNKFIKRTLRIILGLLVLVVLVFGVLYFVYNEKRPEGKPGIAADALANKMLKSVNFDSYKNTRYFEWSFDSGKHHYTWDKENGKVQGMKACP